MWDALPTVMDMKCAVLTDSTSDLNEAQAQQLGVQVLPVTVQFDGRTWEDHRELGSAELFRRIGLGAAMPTTLPPSPEQYAARLDALLQRHDHVLAVHLSSHLSETFARAQEAAQGFAGRVTLVDSLNASGALALQAGRAAHLLGQGLAPTEIQQVLESNRDRFVTRMCLDTLTYLQKGGRIGGAAAAMGGLLKLKPVLGFQDGRVEAFGRVVGEQRAQRQMVQLLAEYARTTPESRVAFFHNGNEEGVEALRHEARRLSLRETLTLDLGTVLSAHGGPGVFGFSVEPQILWYERRPYSA